MAGWLGIGPAPDGAYAKPFRYIGNVYAFYKNGQVGNGTGFLIGRSHVLTAAHVVNDPRAGKALTLMFTPGEYFGRAPFGSANAVKWAVAKPFLAGDQSFDYAIVKLNRPLGDRTRGWFILDSYQPNLIYDVTIAGYTPQFTQGKAMLSGRTSTGLSVYFPDRWWQSPDLSPLSGMSGAPAYFVKGNAWHVVGIDVEGGGLLGLFGLRLLNQFRVEIMNWCTSNA